MRLCAPYLLARPRTTSTDAPRSPSMLAPSQQKVQKNQNKSRKRKKSLLDPGRHFPVPYIGFGAEVYKCEKICIKTNEFSIQNLCLQVYKFVPVRSTLRSIVLEENSRSRENSPARARDRASVRTITCTHPPEIPHGKH